jgi:hypothetical protein
MTTETELTERQRTLTDAQAMLDWLKAHPEIPLPSELRKHNGLSIYAWNSKEEARIMARAMGTFEKNGDETLFRLIKRFGSVNLHAVFSRNAVCERVVLRTEEVPEKVIPERTEPSYTKEIVEYRCPSLLEDESAD